MNRSSSTSAIVLSLRPLGENNSSVNAANWRNLTNTAWLNIEQRYFYIGDPFMIYGDIYSEHATVSVLYLVDKKTGLKSPFRHVY